MRSTLRNVKPESKGNLRPLTTVHHRTEPIAKGLFKHACMLTARKLLGTRNMAHEPPGGLGGSIAPLRSAFRAKWCFKIHLLEIPARGPGPPLPLRL